MKMPTVSYKQAARVLRKTAVKQAPVLLTVIGISSMVSSTVLAVRATPKAILLKEKAEMEKNRDISAYQEAQTLTPVELVRSCWRCYTPAFNHGRVWNGLSHRRQQRPFAPQCCSRRCLRFV